MILLILILLFSPVAYADDLKLDVSKWTQEEKNMTQAAVVKILFENGVSYKNCKADNNGNLIIEEPSKDYGNLLKESNILTEIDQILADADAANQIAQEEEEAKRLELQVNPISEMKLEEIDAETDKAETIEDLKNILKNVVKYVKAKE